MKERVWLVLLSLVLISCFVMMGVVFPLIQEDRVPNDLMGVLGLLMTFSYVANIIIAYRYARKTDRRAGLYALGAFILPYLVPLVLVFLPGRSSGIEARGSSEPAVSEENGNGSLVSQSLFDSFSFPSHQFSKWQLDNLRLFSIILPLSFSWKVVSSSQEKSFAFPDLMDPDEESGLYGALEEICSTGKSGDLSGIKICLADYDSNGTVIDLRKLKKGRMELLAGLYYFRKKRREILTGWIKSNPQVSLRGVFGSTAVLNKEGFHRRKKSISWPEVSTINTETINGMVTHLYVIPEGHSGGMFDFGKGKYSLTNIPGGKKELYVSEVQFWRRLSMG